MSIAQTAEDKMRHYSVYVIELSKDVMNEPKFAKRNPHANKNSNCVYVGMTGLLPAQRFQKHKNKIKHNVYAEKYGIKLLPNLYEKYNPMLFEEAKLKEEELAKHLISIGYAVFWA